MTSLNFECTCRGTVCVYCIVGNSVCSKRHGIDGTVKALSQDNRNIVLN